MVRSSARAFFSRQVGVTVTVETIKQTTLAIRLGMRAETHRAAQDMTLRMVKGLFGS